MPYVEEAKRWLDRGGSAHGDEGRPAPTDGFDAVQTAPLARSARPRIVLADDNADMRDYVQGLLADEEARIEGLQVGADDYLIKPFSARELLARVESHLRMASLRREAQQRVLAILEGLSDGFQSVDLEWRTTYVNPALRRMWTKMGIEPDDVIGKHVLDEAFPDARDTMLGRAFVRAMEERQAVELESYYAPFGRWHFVRCFPSADGGISIFSQDITDRKRADQEIIDRSREIDVLNQRLQRAMSETHHRVKNNLQVISAMIDMQGMKDTESVPRSEMVRVGQHIRSLAVLHDLLTQEAKVAGDVETISAKATLGKLMPILQGIAGRGNISYRCEDLQIPVR